MQFNFHGIISSCFEPHLMVYVELEERTLMESLEKLVQVLSISLRFGTFWSFTFYFLTFVHQLQDEAWGMDDGSQTNILSSSMQVSY